jgi:hypothetical protein
MALSEFYASTILKASASFGFTEFVCDPDEITRALGIAPDEVDRKGARRTIRGGRELDIPFSFWSIRSEGGSKDINEHLRMLLRRIDGKQSLCRVEFGRPAFGVTWKCNYLYAGSGPFYEIDVIAGIASWQAELFQDIYQVDQEGNEPVGPEALMRIPKKWFGRSSPDDGRKRLCGGCARRKRGRDSGKNRDRDSCLAEGAAMRRVG